jgi:anti-anti-sigma factor
MQLTQLPADGPLTRIQCEGQIILSHVQQATDPLERLLGAACYSFRLLFDLEKTTFIDSSGVSWMLLTHRRCNQAGGRIVYHSAPPMVQQILSLLKMHLVLHLAADEAAARTLAQEERP